MRLIDADALTKALADLWYDGKITITGVAVADLIDNAPTVDAERHGKWERTEVEGGKIYVCSECREGIYKSTFEENVHYYCSNCGAKMDKE